MTDKPIWPADLLKDWREFFAGEDKREPGLDLYFSVFYGGTTFPLQRQRETRKMIQRAREIEPRVIVDIGTDKGGGLYHWAKCLPTVERIVSMELRGCPCRDLFELHFPDIDWYWVGGSSYCPENVQRVRTFLRADPIDVLFIDGDKAGTQRDWDAFSPLVRRGGLVMIHDINEPGHPRDTFDRLAETHVVERIIDTTESDEAAERELAEEPVTSAYEGWLRYWKGTSAGVGVVRI